VIKLCNESSFNIHRLGVLLASSNTTLEKEFTCFANYQSLCSSDDETPHQIFGQSDLSFHYSHFPLKDVTEKSLLKMEQWTDHGTKLLSDVSVEAICYGYTSGSLIKGIEFANQIKDIIKRQTEKPLITTTNAILHACKKLQFKDITIVTPYKSDINQVER
jgi:maleate cis-trans isomerase